MASYNRVVLVGNLTRDPQLSYTPANTAVCKFGIATNRAWKDRDGNTREEVCFIDCTVFGRPAETFNQYMSRGQSVLVEGRLQFDTWEGSDGQKRSKHRVSVERFQFLGGPRGGGQQRPQQAPQQRPQQAPPPGGPQAEQDAGEPPPYEDTSDDIPF